MTEPVLVWFRQDLRLDDNHALHAALASKRPILFAYVLDPAPGAIGAAGRWWLHHSLAALDAALRARGAGLLLRRGRPSEAIPRLAEEAGIGTVEATATRDPRIDAEDRLAAAALARDGRRLRLHDGAFLHDCLALRSKAGGVYGVYAPFRKAIAARGDPPPPRPAPARLPAAPPSPPSDQLEDWRLLPRAPDWSGGMRACWLETDGVGEAGAAARLARFAATRLDEYEVARDLPAEAGTSALSPHLHWGEVSPARVWHAAHAAAGSEAAGLARLRGELIWRDFSAYLLHHHPGLPDQPLKPRFAAMPWRDAPGEMESWRRGRTGIPIVDAGMRQLWHTGWMHNRVRMIVASFLAKHLLLPWQGGAAWFMDALVDADPANNAVNWQWVAGCGPDAQPFFRVFNPVGQARRFDPGAGYVARWVPELRGLAANQRHEPWLAASAPAGYPAPIIDLAEGRRRALAAFRAEARAPTPEPAWAGA